MNIGDGAVAVLGTDSSCYVSLVTHHTVNKSLSKDSLSLSRLLDLERWTNGDCDKGYILSVAEKVGAC